MDSTQSSPEISEDLAQQASYVLLNQPQIKQNKCTFKDSAIILIKTCRQNAGVPLSTQFLAKTLNMERRRFSDIINVLDTLAFVEKIDSESFVWKGSESAKQKFKQVAIHRGVFNSELTLEQIFPAQKCISITQISVDLLLIFSVLQNRTLDLKKFSCFLARSNGREQTMICKLYQAAAIFELVNVMEKTKNIGEFEISKEFFIEFPFGPNSVYALLSRPTKEGDFIGKRNLAYKSIHVKKTKVSHKRKVYSDSSYSDY